MNEIHRDDPVTDGERHGIITDLICNPRRGMNGAAVTDVQVRWSDGVYEWVDPDALLPETEER